MTVASRVVKLCIEKCAAAHFSMSANGWRFTRSGARLRCKPEFLPIARPPMRATSVGARIDACQICRAAAIPLVVPPDGAAPNSAIATRHRGRIPPRAIVLASRRVHRAARDYQPPASWCWRSVPPQSYAWPSPEKRATKRETTRRGCVTRRPYASRGPRVQTRRRKEGR